MVHLPPARSGLKTLLVLIDCSLLCIAWLPLMLGGPESAARIPAASLLVGITAVLTALAMIRVQGLWLSRVCSIRSTEVAAIGRATSFVLVSMLVLDRLLFDAVGTFVSLQELIIGGLLMLVMLLAGRSVFRSSVRASRLGGAHGRDVIVIGTGPQAAHLVAVINDHPDYGMRVVGVIGDRGLATAAGLADQWIGPLERTDELVALADVTGVVVCAAALEHSGVVETVKRLQRRNLHIEVASGLAGFDVSRLRHMHIAREPLLYLERVEPRRVDHALKRLIDVTVSIVGLAVTAPVLLAAATAIKLTDRGPVLFTQTRIGMHGRPFTVYKLRTMAIDAEQRMVGLQDANERNGPLFKMEHDPRVSRVGRILRMSSIDEIPQLVNVLQGRMSLVGPRPALPQEVAQFDDDLRRRETVKPGLTGLWQVEARDIPSFDAYRRLDLFYVDNWTLLGDVDIMLDTFEHLVGRLVTWLRSTTTPPTTSGDHVIPARESPPRMHAVPPHAAPPHAARSTADEPGR